jgi:hypothetical protein
VDTTVTGIFPDHQLAAEAVAQLKTAGFRSEQLRVVDSRAKGRHEFIAARTADTRRAVIFGIVFGSLAGVASGALLTGVFEPAGALIVGALVGIVGGAILGSLVGNTTTTQIGTEIEHQVDAGSVLVSIDTDSASAPRALEVLTRTGAVNMVSTATTFRAGVLPITPPGELQQQIEPKP